MRIITRSTILPLLWLATAVGASADSVYTVSLNAMPLESAGAAAPFSLFFDMIQGDPANPVNTATISNFQFGSGSAVSCSAKPSDCSTFGNETGDATGTINLSTGDGFEYLIETFTPGSTLSFTLDLTTHPNTGLAPDTFGFSILDGSLSPIPTLDPTFADTLLTISLGSPSPTIQAWATDPATPTSFGNVEIAMNAPLVSPEPGTLLSLGTALGALIGARRFLTKTA